MGAPPPGLKIRSFAALGDSFTEGLDDPGPAVSFRGWADRFAALIGEPGPGRGDSHDRLRYANLAVRGKRLQDVTGHQVPAAIEMAPDLVSIAAGGNDLLRPGSDPDALAEIFDQAVARLRDAGCAVLVFTGFDVRHFPVLRMLHGKVTVYNAHLRNIAERRQCYLADLWSMAVLRDVRAWSPDRLHLSPEGHRRVALMVSECLGMPVSADWRERWPEAGAEGRLAGVRQDLRWARRHAAPWLGRRLRGVSSGDGLVPKRPRLAPLDG